MGSYGNKGTLLGTHDSSRFDSSSIKDAQLKQAAEQAQREGSERPLVMQQLRDKIQLGRLQKGQNELVVEFAEPRTYELTEEEKQKLEKRKKRNREAAKKSRNKKKDQHSTLQKENRKLKADRDRISEQVKKLQRLTASYHRAVSQIRRCYVDSPTLPVHGQSMSLPLQTAVAVENFLPPQQVLQPVTTPQPGPQAMDFLSVEIPASYTLSSPETDLSTSVQGQYGLPDFDFLESPSPTPSSVSSSPSVCQEANVPDFGTPQSGGLSFMGMLEGEGQSKTDQFWYADGQGFGEKSLPAASPLIIGHSLTAGLSVPDSPLSPGALFRGAQGIGRCP